MTLVCHIGINTKRMAMKRIFITAALMAIFSIAAHAQKYALVDMEYILKNIPQYEMANEQLNQVSLRWQKEVENMTKEAETRKRRKRRKWWLKKKRLPNSSRNISVRKANSTKNASR